MSTAAFLKANGLAKTLDVLKVVTGGSAEATSKLFGSQEAVAGLLPLVTTQADAFTNSLNKQNAAITQGGAATERMAEIVKQSADFQLKRLASTVDSLSTQFGKTFAPAVGTGAQALADIVESLRVFLEANSGTFAAVGDALKGFVERAKGLYEAITTSEEFGIALDALKEIALFAFNEISAAFTRVQEFASAAFSGMGMSQEEFSAGLTLLKGVVKFVIEAVLFQWETMLKSTIVVYGAMATIVRGLVDAFYWLKDTAIDAFSTITGKFAEVINKVADGYAKLSSIFGTNLFAAQEKSARDFANTLNGLSKTYNTAAIAEETANKARAEANDKRLEAKLLALGEKGAQEGSTKATVANTKAVETGTAATVKNTKAKGDNKKATDDLNKAQEAAENNEAQSYANKTERLNDYRQNFDSYSKGTVATAQQTAADIAALDKAEAESKRKLFETIEKERDEALSRGLEAQRKQQEDDVKNTGDAAKKKEEAWQSYKDTVMSVVDGIRSAANTVIETVSSAVSGVTAALETSFKAVTGGFLAGFADSVSGILGGFSNTLKSLTEATKGLGGFDVGVFGNVAAAADSFAEAFVNNIPNIVTAFVKNLPKLVQSLAKALPSLIKTLVAQMPVIIKAIAEGIPVLVDAVIESLPVLVQGLIDNLPTLLDSLIQNLPRLVTGLIDAIIALSDKFGPLIIKLVSTLIQSIISKLPEILNSILKLIPLIINELPKIVQAIADELPGLIGVIMDNLPAIITAIVTAIPQIIAAIIGAIPQIIATFVEKFPEMVVSLVAGIVGALPQIFSSALDTFKSLFDFGSFGKSLWNGLKNGLAGIGSFGGKIWDGIKDAFGKAGSWLGDVGSKMWNGFRKALNAVWEELKKVGSTMWSGFWDGLVGAWDWFKKIGKKIWEGLAEGLNSIGDFIAGNGSTKWYDPTTWFAKGGIVGGVAAVAGDSLRNDTVRAMLSPGELVIPRSVMNGGMGDIMRFVAEQLSGANTAFGGIAQNQLSAASAMTRATPALVSQNAKAPIINVTPSNGEVVVQIDGKEIARAVRNQTQRGFQL
jgi:phage-related protein